MWTRSAGRRKRIGRQLAVAEVEKARREIARHTEFAATVEQISEVNERICEIRPVAGTDAPSAPEGEKGGSSRRSRGRIRRDRAAGGGSCPVAGLRTAGLEAAETVIRAGMLRVGCGIHVAAETITIDLGEDTRIIRRTTTQAVRSIKAHRPREPRAVHVS